MRTLIWIGESLRESGVAPDIDFEIDASALKRVPDVRVLERAAEKNRVLVSHDRRTMPAAFYQFIAERESPGLILIKQLCPVAQAIEALRLCWGALNSTDLVNCISLSAAIVL